MKAVLQKAQSKVSKTAYFPWCEKRPRESAKA